MRPECITNHLITHHKTICTCAIHRGTTVNGQVWFGPKCCRLEARRSRDAVAVVPSTNFERSRREPGNTIIDRQFAAVGDRPCI